MRLNDGRRRFARCSGLARHAATIARALLASPVPHARFSPAILPLTSKSNMRRANAPCENTSVAIMARLCKPGPRNERACNGFEHRNDCNATCAQVTKRTYEQEERDDRAEHDHPRDEHPYRQVHVVKTAEQRRRACQCVRWKRPPRREH